MTAQTPGCGTNSDARKRLAEGTSIEVPEMTALTIQHPDGRALFVFHRDGTVTGDVREAGEAAAVFVREVRRLFGRPDVARSEAAIKAEALREAADEIESWIVVGNDLLDTEIGRNIGFEDARDELRARADLTETDQP